MNRRKLLVVSVLLLTVLCVSESSALAEDPEFAPSVVVTDFFDFGASRRAFGVAAGDFDEDGKADVVASIVNGNVAFVKGNGDGTFAAKTVFPWKQSFFNGWAFSAADVDGDNHLDVVWGASATSSGCSVSPVPAGGCGTEGSEIVTVSDGDVRVYLGNGDGTFEVNQYYVSGTSHNAGTLLDNVGVNVGSLAVGDLENDGLVDVVAGAEDGSDTVVRLLRNLGGGVFAGEDIFRQDKSISLAPPIWFPSPGTFGSTLDTIWGLAIGDIDGDGFADLWVGDRKLYVYSYLNDGTGALTLVPPVTPPIPTRPEVYLAHDVFSVFGYSPSLGSADLNGDGKADLVLGLQQGTQTPASAVANDGSVLLDLSTIDEHVNFAGNPLADLGAKVRGVTLADMNGDGYADILAGNYEGEVQLLLRVPPPPPVPMMSGKSTLVLSVVLAFMLACTVGLSIKRRTT